VLELSVTGLVDEDRQRLKVARVDQRRIQQWSNIIAANVFKVFRLLQWQEVRHTQRYALAISSLQEISESLRDIVVRSKQHVANNHSGLLATQVEDLRRVHVVLDEILERTADALRQKACPDCERIDARIRELQELIDELDQHQIQRIQSNQSKTRLSILFYSLVWDCSEDRRPDHEAALGAPGVADGGQWQASSRQPANRIAELRPRLKPAARAPAAAGAGSGSRRCPRPRGSRAPGCPPFAAPCA
jgi:hypothetical protein